MTQIFDPDAPVENPSLRPRDAATLILVRGGPGRARVLMGRRPATMAFQPNKFVFPGGRLDRGDFVIEPACDLPGPALKKAAAGSAPGRARALALAAVRETFEETGLLVGRPGSPGRRTRSPAWSRFFACGVVPSLERFDFVARAITPPGRPRRFDARFFMADANTIAGTPERVAASAELLEPHWLTLAEARSLDLPNITRRVLDEIEARLGDGADAGRPVPFFRMRHGRHVMEFL